MPTPSEERESVPDAKTLGRSGVLAGCVTAGVGLLVALGLLFFALPFFHLRGRFVADRFPEPQLTSPPPIPQGLHVFPTRYNGRPTNVWVLRVGRTYWAVHVDR